MKCGRIHFRIEELLKERGSSKRELCEDLNISNSQLDRYCKNTIVQIDMRFLCKLCDYFKIEIGELMVYEPEK